MLKELRIEKTVMETPESATTIVTVPDRIKKAVQHSLEARLAELPLFGD